MPTVALFATSPRMNNKIEEGSEFSNGFVKAARKLELMK